MLSRLSQTCWARRPILGCSRGSSSLRFSAMITASPTTLHQKHWPLLKSSELSTHSVPAPASLRGGNPEKQQAVPLPMPTPSHVHAACDPLAWGSRQAHDLSSVCCALTTALAQIQATSTRSPAKGKAMQRVSTLFMLFYYKTTSHMCKIHHPATTSKHKYLGEKRFIKLYD